jgi:3-methyladenine DNA glycosylase Mpg
VAKNLIGKRLVHQVGRRRISGMIVETEAYLGEKDKACPSSTRWGGFIMIFGGFIMIFLLFSAAAFPTGFAASSIKLF